MLSLRKVNFLANITQVYNEKAKPKPVFSFQCVLYPNVT